MKRAAVAAIDEARCIGCALCIEACPVDAIVGARGLMHTVIENHCVGCDLCVPACPVDCIAMLAPQGVWTAAHAAAAKRRARRRRARLAAQADIPFAAKSARLAAVGAAIERVRARRAAKSDRAA